MPNAIHIRPRAIIAAVAGIALVVLMILPPGGGRISSTPHGSAEIRGDMVERWNHRLAGLIDPRAGIEDPAYEELARWLLRGGAEFSSVSGHARNFAAGGRGLFATKPVEKGKVIMRIPSELWFSHRSVMRASAVARILLDDSEVSELINEDQTWAVIIGLLYERSNEYSPWLPYMRFMRRQESTVWWSESELAETHSPHVIESTHEIQKSIKDVYNRLFPYLANKYPTMFDLEQHDLAAFTWATLTMWGRAFNVVGYNATVDTEYGLVPMADLLNHQGGMDSTWNMEYHDPERPNDPTMYVFEANDRYHPTDEITISYGDQRSSFNFFVYSGFIPRGQLYGDYIAIQFVTESGLSDSNFWGCIGADGRPQDEYLIRLQRRMHANDLTPVMKALLKAVVEHEASWPSTYNDDMVQLSRMTSYGSLWAALSYRTRFKYIYKQLRANLEAALSHGSAKLSKFTSKVISNNECHTRRKRFVSFDWAMDKIPLSPDHRAI